MTPREFFDAVVDMREKGRAFYACQEGYGSPKKQELLKAAKEAERKVDAEIMRVLKIMADKEAEERKKQNSPTIQFVD